MKIFGFAWRVGTAFLGRIADTALLGLHTLFAVALLSASPCHVQASDQRPVYSAHVTDLARVLGMQALNLDSKLREFEASTGHQVMVLPVPTTGGRPIDEYAVDIFQKWKVGRADVDDGVLLVVATGDRQMRIEVGYGLEGALTDAQCSRIVHDVVAPQFAQGRYEAGVEEAVDAILLALSPPSSGHRSAAVPPDLSAHRVAKRQTDPGEALAFIGLVLAGIAIFTIWLGLAGLFLFALFACTLLMLTYPAQVAAVVSGWLNGRWLLIADNVRKYHLANSTNHFATWVEVFFFTRDRVVL